MCPCGRRRYRRLNGRGGRRIRLWSGCGGRLRWLLRRWFGSLGSASWRLIASDRVQLWLATGRFIKFTESLIAVMNYWTPFRFVFQLYLRIQTRVATFTKRRCTDIKSWEIFVSRGKMPRCINDGIVIVNTLSVGCVSDFVLATWLYLQEK